MRSAHRSNLEDGSRIEFNLAPHGEWFAAGPIQEVEPEQDPGPARSVDLSPLKGIPDGLAIPALGMNCREPARQEEGRGPFCFKGRKNCGVVLIG